MDTPLLLGNIHAFRSMKFAGALLFSTLATTFTFSQEPPSSPPDIDVLSAPPFTPGIPDPWVIPPFNSALPESTTLGEDQNVVLRAVSTNSGLTNYQWFKDGDALPGKTRDTLEIEMVSSEDAGVYQVDVGLGNSLISSIEIEFIVVPLSEIDELFSEWLSRFFTSEEIDDPNISGESADPDFDGIANLAEYAFGLNPKSRDTPPKIAMGNGKSTTSTIVFARAKGRNSVAFSVEGSSELEVWVPLAIVASRIESLDMSKESVEFEVDWNIDPEFPRFLRLKASQSVP